MNVSQFWKATVLSLGLVAVTSVLATQYQVKKISEKTTADRQIARATALHEQRDALLSDAAPPQIDTRLVG
ncbi:hypothetical protein PQ455_13880 [Sphingomonas naphthae]|uniref:Uncharacterized protein n=1 Tax=Sphingomonas naphthae TaxID=1813468 RepID=A0ABY7TJ19_9SPHN|nr:hypothetical protein [Sphingomonas naphthae]WCT72717.1 hypothetical protein PQ455_13880 [Sphingomonas naphthae]